MSADCCQKCGSEMIKCYVDIGVGGLLVKNPNGDKLFTNKKNKESIQRYVKIVAIRNGTLKSLKN